MLVDKQIKFELASFQWKSSIAVWKQQFNSIQAPKLWYSLLSKENEYHLKLTNKNTIQSCCMHIILVF